MEEMKKLWEIQMDHLTRALDNLQSDLKELESRILNIKADIKHLEKRWVCGVDHRRCIETGIPYIVDIDRLNAVFQAAKKVCEVKIITKDSLGLEVLQDLRAAVREAENV